MNYEKLDGAMRYLDIPEPFYGTANRSGEYSAGVFHSILTTPG